MTRDRTIVITAGDPCGIGPEVVLASLARDTAPARVRLVVIGEAAIFERAAHRLHRRLPAWQVLPPTADLEAARASLILIDCAHRGRFIPGRSSAAAGAASLAYLDHALAWWRAKRLHALVTAPVTKWAIRAVRPSFVGQTEYLSRAMGAGQVVMMFVSDRLRVALLTRHVALRRVPSAITPGLLKAALRLTARTLTTHFQIRRPRLALCGLNPHAAEGARAPSEERRVMAPVLRAMRREGLICDGPFAADGFFIHFAKQHLFKSRRQASRQGFNCRRYDAVMCAYHDQGLIPFKLLARDAGCQLSAGLPIIRTSPDHGSALDIAGRGVADPGSMRYALTLAIRLACRPTPEDHPSFPRFGAPPNK